MSRKKSLFRLSILMILAVSIHLYGINPSWVESGYSTAFFPGLARTLRSIFGWLPFSIGDLLYGAVVIYGVLLLIRIIKILFRKRTLGLQHRFVDFPLRFLRVCCSIYIVFNLFWGLNYNRKGIASQLNLEISKYSVEELKAINAILVEKTNTSKLAILRNGSHYPDSKELFVMTVRAYNTIAQQYPFLHYRRISLKPSLWSRVGNYTGFLGYYNPFTGEAQVNTTVPKFTQPFTACHETAHQLGYAKEMEANFVGYLAAAASPDTLFHYSVYTDLFTYANRSLYFADSTAAQQFRKMLLPEVLADFKERREFNLAHTSFLEPVFRAIYGVFLKSNQQPMGMLSYDEVTGFIIAYYKKFGRI